MMFRVFRLVQRFALQASILLALAVILACGGGEPATAEPAAAEPTIEVVTEDPVLTAAPAATIAPDATADNGSPTAAPPATAPPAAPVAIEPILATTVLEVGEQRVAFLLTTSEGLIKEPESTVTSVYLGEGDAAGEETQAGFHLWPFGVRGSYSTQLTFDRPGPWRLDIAVDLPDGPAHAEILLDVAEETSVPAIGSIPPFATNKTVYTVEDLSELTTNFEPDPELYQITIGDARISGNPTVIVFATPAFCTSPTCGPQVATVAELKDLYRDEANFIHVELYDNPEEIQGDLDKAELSSLVHDWGFSSIPHWFNESWTFVLGQDGRIAQRFEAFATLEELEEALLAALDGA